jgi:hypothetical protein
MGDRGAHALEDGAIAAAGEAGYPAHGVFAPKAPWRACGLPPRLG